MAAQDDADLIALEQATAELVDALTGFTDDEGDLPTPCAEWDLNDLVDHVTGGNWFTIHVLAGETADAAMAATIARFADGPASPTVAIVAAEDQLEAVGRPGVLDGTWHHVAGRLPGRQLLRLRLHDLIIHTWDINETRRPPASISPALAQWGLDELDGDESLMAEHFALPEPTGDRPRADDPSSLYLSAFGRRPTTGRATDIR